jgi:hypothetical protein
VVPRRRVGPIAGKACGTDTSRAGCLLVGWDAMPASLTSIGVGGARLAGGGSAVMLVPSVVVPEEFNVLVYPAYHGAAGVVGRKVRKWVYAGRVGRG